MKQFAIVALATAIVSPAAPAAGTQQASASAATSKSVAQFGTCFVAAQERASLPWSWVPKPHGGTFSNLGAQRAGSAYFLAVSDRGASRAIRLEPADRALPVDARVAHAVDQCA